jgi:hypothetical protein
MTTVPKTHALQLRILAWLNASELWEDEIYEGLPLPKAEVAHALSQLQKRGAIFCDHRLDTGQPEDTQGAFIYGSRLMASITALGKHLHLAGNLTDKISSQEIIESELVRLGINDVFVTTSVYRGKESMTLNVGENAPACYRAAWYELPKPAQLLEMLRLIPDDAGLGALYGVLQGYSYGYEHGTDRGYSEALADASRYS